MGNASTYRIRSLVRARERDEGAGASAAAVGDGDLGAGDVELGAACCGRRVQSDVLDAEEVVARGQGLGDGDADLGFAWGLG
jgi:hypothetical protein